MFNDMMNQSIFGLGLSQAQGNDLASHMMRYYAAQQQCASPNSTPATQPKPSKPNKKLLLIRK